MKRNIISSKKSATKATIEQPLTEEYKTAIRAASYLGKRGYTVPKSVLTEEDIAFLKKDLFLKPEIPGAANYGPSQEATAFPVYRENDKKLYIPRFYGIERYGGLPARCEIAPGIDIDVPFVKSLRDYQENIVRAYLDATEKGPNGGILQIFTGAGKTVMALNIVSKIAKKTLILVHKEFLLQQWIERIAEYLPTARVGKIQAQVLDIENKDIVIGMIQTLYNRTFPQEVYDQFGLLICDEVHHIASEQFSKTLLTCISAYTLGISATVKRKDGLTKLLHMFLGPMIYSMDRKKDDIVSVYGIEYRTGDAEFNEVELDYMGKPKYSTMISKICDYIPRQLFIIRIIEDLVIKNPGAQMIILGHNRSLLTALYDGVKYKNFASCGYYLGGMKQKDLKESEDKTVIVSTYAMAAEALDIPTLSILVMVTSKTDIVQSVGRILRKKHENPLIVDIIDSHSIFQNQWTRRKTYYRKCNYRIRYINSHQYNGSFDDENWLKVYDPKMGAVIGDLTSADRAEQAVDEIETQTIFGGKCMIDLG